MLNLFLILTLILGSLPLQASEVLDKTQSKVVVRNHPRTGKPFVSITDAPEANPFPETKRVKRPDYRMLDPKIKPGTIPYEGPVSDRRKVYMFAATLAAIGTVGGASIIAAAPAATGSGAAGGAGLYGASGVGVAAGTVSASMAASKSDPKKENFKHVSEAKEL